MCLYFIIWCEKQQVFAIFGNSCLLRQKRRLSEKGIIFSGSFITESRKMHNLAYILLGRTTKHIQACCKILFKAMKSLQYLNFSLSSDVRIVKKKSRNISVLLVWKIKFRLLAWMLLYVQTQFFFCCCCCSYVN